jgi:hypothetical protein
LSRAIEISEQETILYGAKDSFSEQLEHNITLIRRRLPLTELKTENFTVGSLSKTTIVLMYIEGLTNPEYISIARHKISEIDFDLFLIRPKLLLSWKIILIAYFRSFNKPIDRMSVLFL